MQLDTTSFRLRTDLRQAVVIPAVLTKNKYTPLSLHAAQDIEAGIHLLSCLEHEKKLIHFYTVLTVQHTQGNHLPSMIPPLNSFKRGVDATG